MKGMKLMFWLTVVAIFCWSGVMGIWINKLANGKTTTGIGILMISLTFLNAAFQAWRLYMITFVEIPNETQVH